MNDWAIERDAATLLLIDLSAVYWQAYHSASPGEGPTAPCDRTVNRVRMIIEAHPEVSDVVVCCDGRSNWRRERYTPYKIQREERPPEAIVQLRNAKAALASTHRTIERDGFEADDVIATLARDAWANGRPVVIATADKDLAQLIRDDDRSGPAITIHDTRSDTQRGTAWVVEKFGVQPERVRDFLALTGDTSDNVPGVKDVGPKRAAALLAAFGDVEGVIAAAADPAQKMTDAVRANITAGAEMLRLAYELVGLRFDVPIEEPPREREHESMQQEQTNGAAAPPPKSEPKMPATRTAKFSVARVSTEPAKTAMRTIVTGKSGIGKTFLVSTIPAVFILAIEDGLRGKSPDHSPAYFRDESGRPILPKTLRELHEAIDVFAREVNAPGADGKRPFRHLAIDGLTGIESLVHQQVCGDEKVKHMEGKDFRKLWHAAEPLMAEVQRKLDAVRDTGVHVWLIAHSAEVIDASSTTGETYRKWDLLMKGGGEMGTIARNMWRQWAENVFFVDWAVAVKAGGKGKRSIGEHKGRVLYTRERATHYAKSRDRLPDVIPAEWADLARALAAGSSMTEEKARTQIAKVAARLSPEHRALIEEDAKTASGANALARVLSRAEGMLAIAESESESETTNEEDAAPAAE